MTKVEIIGVQRKICQAIIDAYLFGCLEITETEQKIVLKLKAFDKPLKDWHLAILKAFIERMKDADNSDKLKRASARS